MIVCDQYQCEHHRAGLHPEKSKKGVCIADKIELAEAPGGFWLSCRMKTNGKQWRPEKPEHVCGKQGFRVSFEGMWDVCQACEREREEREANEESGSEK